MLIMTDQQCAGAMSCTGNPHVKTPALDRLAANGIRFEKAYTTQPLCMPCRASMQTGRYPHETGMVSNGIRFQTFFPMVGSILSEAGYDCAYYGKWHVGVDEEDRKHHGYAVMEKLRDDLLPGAAAAFLQRKRNKPFFLTLSFINPHDTCQLARGQALPQGPIPPTPEPKDCPPLPRNFPMTPNEPSVIRRMQKKYFDFEYPTLDWDDGKWRQYLWGYYRLVEKVDAQIGQVLGALRTSGLEDQTLVVFACDHGDGAAAHHWNQKQILYDEVVRVPLIITQKGATLHGSVDREHLVSTGIDFLPTVLDFANLPIPRVLPGKSLKLLVTGQPIPSWRDHLITETGFSRNAGHSGVFGRMVRSDRFKYIVYSEGENPEQLFDMQTDPGEMKNLAGDPNHRAVLEDHRHKLKAWMVQTNDAFPFKT